MEDQNDKIIADNLKLARAYIFLKREVVLLRSEREDRERRVVDLESRIYHVNDEFASIKTSFNNIKEMQNYTSYENAQLKVKVDYLESKIIELIYPEKK